LGQCWVRKSSSSINAGCASGEMKAGEESGMRVWNGVQVEQVERGGEGCSGRA
jgi:hypothetical protein